MSVHSHCITGINYLRIVLTATFQAYLEHARSPSDFFLHLFWKRASRDKWHRLLLSAGCPSCHPTNSVKPLKRTQSTDPNQWPGLTSLTTRLLTWLTDWVQVLRPHWTQNMHFGDVLQANLLAWYRKTKPNTTKAPIHQSKQMYYNTK